LRGQSRAACRAAVRLTATRVRHLAAAAPNKKLSTFTDSSAARGARGNATNAYVFKAAKHDRLRGDYHEILVLGSRSTFTPVSALAWIRVTAGATKTEDAKLAGTNGMDASVPAHEQ
jgi:hypothetical protein